MPYKNITQDDAAPPSTAGLDARRAATQRALGTSGGQKLGGHGPNHQPVRACAAAAAPPAKKRASAAAAAAASHWAQKRVGGGSGSA